jgi:hypothetical protein
MNKNYNLKKIISRFLIAASLVLFLFSLIFMLIAYNVSSMRAAMNENNKGGFENIEKIKQLYPDYFTLASLEIRFPAAALPIAAGGTFESYLNKTYHGKDTADWGYRYTIISSLGEHFKITDEAYLNSFYDMNSRFAEEIITSYDRPFASNDLNAQIILHPADGKVYEQCWLACIINNSMILKIAYRALAKKDYALALKSDIAYLRFSSAAGVLGDPCLSNIINYDLYTEYNLAKQIYLNEDFYLSGEAPLNKFKDALLKRVEFIKNRPDFAAAFKNTTAMLERKTAGLKWKDKATLYALNLWYGDPDADFIETSKLIYSKKGAPCSEYEKILEDARIKYPLKRSFMNELAYTGDGLLSLFKFVKFAVNTHPLAPNAYIPNQELAHFINTGTKLRLVTLGGFARHFYAVNKRWPDLAKDDDFLKEAGPAAIDAYCGKPFIITQSEDGGKINIKSAAKDWYDHVSKETKYIELNVARPQAGM